MSLLIIDSLQKKELPVFGKAPHYLFRLLSPQMPLSLPISFDGEMMMAMCNGQNHIVYSLNLAQNYTIQLTNANNPTIFLSKSSLFHLILPIRTLRSPFPRVLSQVGR